MGLGRVVSNFVFSIWCWVSGGEQDSRGYWGTVKRTGMVVTYLERFLGKWGTWIWSEEAFYQEGRVLWSH